MKREKKEESRLTDDKAMTRTDDDEKQRTHESELHTNIIPTSVVVCLCVCMLFVGWFVGLVWEPPHHTTPNQTKPNQTKPNQTKPNQTGLVGWLVGWLVGLVGWWLVG